MLKRATYLLLALFGTVFCHAQTNAVYQNLWQNMGQAPAPAAGMQKLFPRVFQQFYVQEGQLEQLLLAAGATYETASEITLPAPDGSYRTFRVWRNATMSKELQAAYPMIHTWSAEDVTNRQITAELDYTVYGFHAMVFEPDNTWFIDPLTNQKTGYYLSYNRRDYTRPLNQRMHCLNGTAAAELGLEPMQITAPAPQATGLKVNGSLRRNYRLALACTYEYSVAVTGSSTPEKPDVISAMVTSMNRVNGIYKRELSVEMTMIDNTSIVYVTNADPYTNNDGSALLNENQTNLDAVIGTANYDLGHVFCTGSGGIASLGSVCAAGTKARAFTGLPMPVGDAFDIDYVSHEMGHQFGGEHIFNNDLNGSCAGNMSASSAYEPASGSTIMGYAGICAPEDLQDHSDPYFHFHSLDQITSFITTGGGAFCATSTPSANSPSGIASFTATYQIPASTPFELTAPNATDPTADTLLYNWEQYNLGNPGAAWNNTMSDGPIFRSFLPTTSTTRVFPTLPRLLTNAYPYLGEKLPTVARNLTFRLSVRDIYQGWGCVNLPDDSVVLKVNAGTGPFVVNGPNTPLTWLAGSSQLIQWNVANTSLPPINAEFVDIYLSTDGGYTYPYLLLEATPNDGSEVIIVPALNTSQARIKVKGSGNVFFNINSVDFGIYAGLGVGATAWADDVSIYPVPARQEVFVNAGNQQLQGTVANALGQQVWAGSLQGKTSIRVAGWAPGVYYLKLSREGGESAVKTLVVYQ